MQATHIDRYGGSERDLRTSMSAEVAPRLGTEPIKIAVKGVD